MNTIGITAYRRPELLKIQLDQLIKDMDEFIKYRVHIFLDYGFDPDNFKVIKEFKKYNSNIKLTTRTEFESKSSPLPAFYNIMDSYRQLAEESDEFCIIMEEDIIVTSDYLRFNRQCYENFLSKYDRLFCICHKRRPETELKGNINLVMADFQLTSPSCISVNNIKKFILPHLNNSLYNNPIDYYYNNFNNIDIKYNDHIHHDGFLEKVMLKNNLWSLKPDQARSSHIGVGGQHDNPNSKKIVGTLEQKVKLYYNLISKGSSALREYVTLHKTDIVVTNLDNESYKELYIDVNRNKCIASTWFRDKNNEFKEYYEKMLHV